MKAPTAENRAAAAQVRKGEVPGRQRKPTPGSLLPSGRVDEAIAWTALREWLSSRPDKSGLVAGISGMAPLPSERFPPDTEFLSIDDTGISESTTSGRRRSEAVDRCTSNAVASVDLVIGDGAFNRVSFPADFADWCSGIRRHLRPGGRCVIRSFAQRQAPESKEEVFADLSRGAVDSFNALLLRVAMAIQADPGTGVSDAELWEGMHEMWSSAERLAACYRWPIEEVKVLDALQSSQRRYFFASVTEYERLITSAGFVVRQVLYPVYELGERCPTFVFERGPDPQKLQGA